LHVSKGQPDIDTDKSFLSNSAIGAAAYAA
jgi:hypothetical protein